jgi:hypothetical protein
MYRLHCLGDKELIESLLFDAEATRGTMSSWMKENYDGIQNDSTSRRLDSSYRTDRRSILRNPSGKSFIAQRLSFRLELFCCTLVTRA